MPTPPRSRRTADERRTQIADAAIAIAREAGLVAVTLRSVATEIGVAPALVAHYEPSMDDLVARTFSAIVATELREIAAIADAQREPRHRMSTVLCTLLDRARADVTLVWMQAWALGGRSEPLAVAVREQMDAWEAFLAALIATMDAVPDRTPQSRRLLARQILGMIDGLNAHALVRWNDGDAQVVLLTRSVEAILHLPDGALRAADRPAL